MKTSTIVGILVGVVIFTSLLPTIANNIAGLDSNASNVTGASLVLVGLVPLFIVIGFVIKLAGGATGSK